MPRCQPAFETKNAKHKAKGRDAKATANMVIGSVFAGLNKAGLAIAKSPVSAEQVGQLVDLQSQDVVSSRIAKEVFELMVQIRDAWNVMPTKGPTLVQ